MTGRLTPKQKLFCFHYIVNDELRRNATLAYNEAYEMGLYEKSKQREKDEEGEEIPGTSEYDKCYNSCSALSSRLLRNVKVQKENERLWNKMLNDKKVGSRLSKIIYTGKDNDSLNGIKIYNDLNARIEKAKQKALDDGKISEKVIDPLTARLKELGM